jgi:hypothetical protein
LTCAIRTGYLMELQSRHSSMHGLQHFEKVGLVIKFLVQDFIAHFSSHKEINYVSIFHQHQKSIRRLSQKYL